MKPLPMRPMRSFGLVMSKIPVHDQIGVDSALEEVDYVLNGRHRHPLCRLLRQAGDVRREHNLVECQERMILCGRLVVEYVETRGGNTSIGQSRGQRGLVKDPAAGGVDDDSARLEPREFLLAEDWPARLRDVHRNDVG